MQEELSGKKSGHGFQQKLRNQAGKLRSRFKGIQGPSFTIPARHRSEKKKPAPPATTATKSKTKKASKMERFKMALPERPRFSFPDTSKLSLPNRPKFNIKRPDIHLPSAFSRSRKATPSLRVQKQQSTESTYGSRKNIFDFSTYPRIFDKKSKNKPEYTTSSPKESRSQSAESATFPRTKKSFSARWAQRFRDTKLPDEELVEPRVAIERSRPWRHPSLEEPRLAFRMQASESLEESEKLPWETTEQKAVDDQEEIQYADYEEDSQEISEQREPRPNDETKPDISFDKDPMVDPRKYGDQTVNQEVKDPKYITEVKQPGRYTQPEDEVEIEEIEEVEVIKFKRIESFENGDMDEYESSFPPVDPVRFNVRKMSSEERSSVRSDKEQQSSGSSCERRGRGVIEEIDSDEFFLREKGISQDDMSVGRYIVSEIREALRSTPRNALADVDIVPIPPQRPIRTRSLRKRKEDFLESYTDLPPARPKRERTFRQSEESLGNLERTGSFSSAAHRIVYRADTISHEQSPAEPLDNIVIVKPIRRKSRSSLRSQSQPITDSSVNITPGISNEIIPPTVPTRRKRNRHADNEHSQIQHENGLYNNGVINSICNGGNDWNDLKPPVRQHPPTPPPTPPLAPASVNKEIIEEFALRLKQEICERPPLPPKRRSRSRTASFIQDDDRTSHGAESLPEMGYIEDDIPQDASPDQLPGYAIIEKHTKPSRPPPPRRCRDKFATTPRSSAPKRPQRAYSTLGPAKRRPPDSQKNITRSSEDIMQYVEVNSDGEDKDLRSGKVLSKIQGRPLPAPPRPPRSHRTVEKKDHYEPESVQSATEAVASTQTDPLPDDLVIEEEITQAKLIMAPSRSGSQILISTERIPTPTLSHTPPIIPPLPTIQNSENKRVPEHREASEEKAISNKSNQDAVKSRLETSAREEEANNPEQGEVLRTALLSDEPLRINSLEVGDLRVDRLSVSQLEAHKVSASEIDAIIVSASEMSGKGSVTENGISPSLLQELIAIRSHLENVAQVQERPPSRMEDACTATSNERIDAITLSAVKIQDSTRKSPAHEVESVSETGSGRLDVEKLDATQIKSKQVAEQSTQPNLESETLQAQVLQAEKLKPNMEAKSELRHTTISSTSTTRESSIEKDEKRDEKQETRSRSRSTSPSRGAHIIRQTASPVKSLPPVISVTPDIPDTPINHIISSEVLPQRAIISYSEPTEKESTREFIPPCQDNSPPNAPQFVTFQTSQIPAQFFSLASPTTQQIDTEPSITETTQELLRALRIAGTRALRHFVNYIVTRVGTEESVDKIRQVELALCALLLIIAGLLIILFGSPRTVTHHHHWDYFNPPQ